MRHVAIWTAVILAAFLLAIVYMPKSHAQDRIIQANPGERLIIEVAPQTPSEAPQQPPIDFPAATMGPNDAALFNVSDRTPDQICWVYRSCATEADGADGMNTPGWDWATAWFIMPEGQGNLSYEAEVCLTDMRMEVLRDGQWVTTHTGDRVGARQWQQRSDYFTGASIAPLMTVGAETCFWPRHGYNHHGWFGGRQYIGPVDGVRVLLRARMTVPQGQHGVYLVQVGADRYLRENGSAKEQTDEAGRRFVPLIGNSRAVVLGPEYRWVVFERLAQ